MRPAGQLPPGVPTGPVQQTGSSVTPTLVAVVAGAVLLTGVLAYTLIATAPAPARRRRRR